MLTLAIKSLASNVATLLGEPLALECSPEESPFPNIEDRVRILAPGLLKDLLSRTNWRKHRYLKSFSRNISIDEAGVVSIPLPEDFLNLVEVKMSDWKIPVTQISESTPDLLLKMASPFSGIRGNPENPVALISTDATGDAVLKLFSSSKGATLEMALYVPMPAIGIDDTLSIPPCLLDELLEMLAGKITVQQVL